MGQIGIKAFEVGRIEMVYQDEVRFTFQSMQYKETWSRLDRMYVMHDIESFLREMLNMSIMREDVTSDHFPICFEFNKHGVDMYKTLLHRVPLRTSYFKRMACMGYNTTKHQLYSSYVWYD